MSAGAGDGNISADSLAGYSVIGSPRSGTLQKCLGSGDRTGSGNCCSAISPERLTGDGYHLAASGDGTVVQLDRGAAGGIKLHGCVAAIDDQHSTVLYRQRPVLHSQARLSNLAVSRFITLNKYLTPDRHISGGDHHGFIAGAVCQIAVGQGS